MHKCVISSLFFVSATASMHFCFELKDNMGVLFAIISGICFGIACKLVGDHDNKGDD